MMSECELERDCRQREERAALWRWQETEKKLTEDQKGRIEWLVSTLECCCLRVGNGRVWLGIEAKTMLASAIYNKSWLTKDDD